MTDNKLDPATVAIILAMISERGAKRTAAACGISEITLLRAVTGCPLRLGTVFQLRAMTTTEVDPSTIASL